MDFFKMDKLYKIYFFNIFLVLAIFTSIYIMFFVQFKTNNLHNKINSINNYITELNEEIKIMEVEWIYITRPQRLRELSKKYLENKNIEVSQVKTLKEFNIINLTKDREFALNN